MPPGPPTPQDSWGGPPAAPGLGYGAPPDPGFTAFPTPGGAPPPPAAGGGWGQEAAPPPGGYYGGPPAPPVDQGWQQAPAPIAVGGGGAYGDRGPYARRKSLLIGISYRNSIRPLGGTHHTAPQFTQLDLP
jgi:hypothetical protein